MARPYARFGWKKLGSPMTPVIYLKFRGAETTPYIFPSRSNNVYIYNANFDVLNENGFSSATITLADPNFVNLEQLAFKSLYLANSFSRNSNHWFCAAMWGWSYYGTAVKNPGEDDTELSQYKLSGLHYYMLSNLTYDQDEVELRVTFELLDVGQSTFGPGDDDQPRLTVGRLNPGGGVSLEQGSEDAAGEPNENFGDFLFTTRDDESLNAVTAEEGNLDLANPLSGASTGDTEGIDDPENASGQQVEAPIVYNVFRNKTPWEIIKRLCKDHRPEIVVETKEPADDDRLSNDEDQKLEEKRIASTAGFRESIQELLNLIPTDPPADDPASETTPVRRWGILAGGSVEEGDPTQKLVFGWIPEAPKRGQELNLDERYRLARTFTYRPGDAEEISDGETMINSLKFEWTSKGFWNLNMPTIYAIIQGEDGQPQIIYTEDDWKSTTPDERVFLRANPTVNRVSLNDAIGSLADQGFKLDFNFDMNNLSSEQISQKGRTFTINVWNFFIKELMDVSIEIPGDPFLDNRIYTRKNAQKVQSPNGISDGGEIQNLSGGNQQNVNVAEDNLKDLLIDLYDAYFIIKVYRLDRGGGLQVSPLFEGKYLCLNGCSHRISEGEFVTSLRLFKAF